MYRSQISLQSRLRGGEKDIRTLGTGLNRARAHTSVTYRESITSGFSADCPPTAQSC